MTPDGYEVIPSGSEYTISWDAALTAVTFNLVLSLDQGATWNPIPGAQDITGNTFAWGVPRPRSNKKRCFIKVTCFDSNGKRVGSDRSAAPFTIEVVNVTSPNGGESLKSGTPYKITWATNGTKLPVSRVKLYYTKDGGTTWLQIPAKITGNPGFYDWTVPAVKTSKVSCKVRTVLLDASGNSLGSDSSDAPFTINPP
jgi:hypothetical protein